jgi:hypothetical protein
MSDQVIHRNRLEQLPELAVEINDREKTLEALRRQAADASSDWICEVALQGQALIRVRQTVSHGQFGDWIKTNCPFSYRSAARYMTIARQMPRVADASSLRHALLLLTQDQTGKGDGGRSEVLPYLAGLGRISKLCTYISTHPLHDWPDEGKAKARADLLPIAQDLYPEVPTEMWQKIRNRQ